MRHSEEQELERVWSEFVMETRTLLAIHPDDMTAEQRERFETISDAFIHLVGYVQSRRPSELERDPRLRDELARRRRLRPRTSAREAGDAGGGLFTDAQRVQLRDRILSGIQAARLGVREAQAPPPRTPLKRAETMSPALLNDTELVHRAPVMPGLSIAAGAGRELWDAECDSTIELPPDLARGRYVALAVTGDSMEPLMHSGDTVLVRVEERVRSGTVVVARDPDHGYVVKEVGRLTAAGIELRSLNRAYRPFVVPHAPGAVLGAVVLRWCPHPELHAMC